jgi:hypothetical protein
MKKTLTLSLAACLALMVALSVTFSAKGANVYTTLFSQWIQNSLIDSTPIGQTTPAVGSFTDIYDTNLGSSNSFLCTTTGGKLTNTGCVSPTLMDEYATFSGCSYANDGANITCSTPVTLAPAMPDTSYMVSCSWYSPVNPYMIFNYNITGQTTTGYTYTQLTSGSSSNYTTYGTNYGLTVVCHAHHN